MSPTSCRLLVSVVITSWAVVAAPGISSAVDDPQWQLPSGFTIELVAGPPLVNHPTMGGFDDQGRLYICDGPGENMPAKDLLAKFPNFIRRLEDVDGDGKFDRGTMFADKMTFPMGALWHDGYVYTASPPHIWKLRDADGDGIAEERKILVSEFGFTGNAADIHGCFLGPDGRIYWCDGRHGHNFVDENGVQISKGLAARLFSCKTDGSDVEAFAGGGMDNPVEVAFTEEGEPLGTVAIFDNKPDRVDAIVHWVYGGAYPYYPKVLDEFKKTGDLLPAVSRFGRVAPSGIMRYRHPHFGDEYRDNLFHAQFNTHRVVRTKLERDGATFKSTDEDFLVSPNPDVHLTDVIEDADGSLLVVDTGGWFRIGCPTSQIAKPDILGGIYRIRRTDGKKLDDPRGLRLAWEKATFDDLIERLTDHRPAVRDRAIATLAARGKADAQVVTRIMELYFKRFQESSVSKSPITSARDDWEAIRTLNRNLAWTLARIDTPEARNHLSLFMREKTLQIAMRTCRPDGDAWRAAYLERVKAGLRSDTASQRREAATALGRFRDPGCIPDLLQALKTSNGDRFLEHSIIYALIQIDQPAPIALGLNDEHPNVRRGALIALDQLDSELLTRDAVATLLDSTDATLQTTALGVMQKHADWAPAVVGWLKSQLANGSLTPEQSALVQSTFLAYKADAATQQLLADSLADERTTPAGRRVLLEVIERSELTGKLLPKTWEEQIVRSLAAGDVAVVGQAVATAAVVGTAGEPGPFDGPLMTLVRDDRRPPTLRIAALKALGSRVGEPDAAIFDLLTSRLQTTGDALDRLAAAGVLGHMTLNPSQRAAIVGIVASAGPIELPALLTIFEKDSLPDEGRRLMEALARSPGLENVTSSQLRRIVAGYPEDVRESAEPLFKRIDADVETQRARLAELSAQMDGGDVVRGKNIFTLKTTACINCHKVQGQGAEIGPDLTKVGQIRSRIDLLESLIYPSAGFVRGYESVAITTSAGLEHVGILARETPEAVYLKTAQRQEVRIARSDIEELRPSKLSIMPQGMDKVMTVADLRDVIAYLQSLK